MNFFTVQPAFTIEVPIPVDDLMKRFRGAVKKLGLQDLVGSAGDCVDLKVARDERRFWSPHLNVQASEMDDRGSELFCRFSPRPEIWTMFMAIYMVSTCIIFAAGIYGYVQWVLGQTPWAFAIIPVGGLVILVLHVISLVGQRLSSDQMDELRVRLDRLIARATEEE